MNRTPRPTDTAPPAPQSPRGPTSSTPSAPATPLPHERDQGVGQVDAAPQPVIEQAHRDLQAGQVDTDLRATAGQDAPRRDRLLGRAEPGARAGAVGERPQAVAPPADGRRPRRR